MLNFFVIFGHQYCLLLLTVKPWEVLCMQILQFLFLLCIRFLSFDEQPIAAASIAQVHYGLLKDNQEVAVKVGNIVQQLWTKLVVIFSSVFRYS